MSLPRIWPDELESLRDQVHQAIVDSGDRPVTAQELAKKVGLDMVYGPGMISELVRELIPPEELAWRSRSDGAYGWVYIPPSPEGVHPASTADGRRRRARIVPGRKTGTSPTADA